MPKSVNWRLFWATVEVEIRSVWRIFLDANILFSAAQSDGAIRRLLTLLSSGNHVLVADGYVVTEAQRNIAAKANAASVQYLVALLSQIEISAVQFAPVPNEDLLWLPPKDRPVLEAAIRLGCDVLVTGDSSHFGTGYGKSWQGVTIYSPAQLAQVLLVADPAQRH